MNNETKTLTIFDQSGKEMTVQVLLTFLIPDLGKRYVVYTLDENPEGEKVNVLISEVDEETYKIKEIPESEIQTVIDFYKGVKRMLVPQE